MAKKLRSSMPVSKMRDFEVGPMANKPGHVAALNSHPNAARLGAYLHAKKGSK